MPRFLIIKGLILWLYVPFILAATPKFNIMATNVVTRTIQPDETITVHYLVTNNTKLTRTLTIVPIQGVSFFSGSPFCTNPFTLASGASCQMRLSIVGSQISAAGIHQGPEICKTQYNANTPDLFLCSQPASLSQLDITLGSGTILNATPNPLYVNISTIGTVTIQNTGTQTVSALTGSITPNTITLTNNCGSTLSSGATCTMQVTASSAVDGTLTIEGSNTNTEKVAVHVAAAAGNNIISITSPIVSKRIIPLGSTLTLTLLNNGPAAATNVGLGDVSSCPGVSASGNTCGSSLAVGDSCQLTLTSVIPYVACPITITGTNVVTLSTYIAFRQTVASTNTPGVTIDGLVYKVIGNTAYIITERDPAGREGLAPWWNGSASTPTGASSLTNGATNTTLILSAWTQPSPPQDIAASVCQNAPVDTSWFLPAFCELSADSSVCVPTVTNVQVNLFDLGFLPELRLGANGTGTYWSSTVIDANNAWAQVFANGVTSGSQLSINSSHGVRCATTFTF